jgi:quinoprotein glucose dehydrogenase
MDDRNDAPTSRPRYRWPRLVLALLFLGVILAILWVALEARRLHRYRSPNPLFDRDPATNPAGPTNSAAIDDPLAPYRGALNGGDIAAGRKVFFDLPAANCGKCHRVAGNGGDIGPALDGIGSRQTREFILESLMLPNRRITEGYESVVVRLKNGDTASGVLKRETETELVLSSSDGVLVTVNKSDVEFRQKGLSPMPEGLGQLMSERQLRDLIEFVASLKN